MLVHVINKHGAPLMPCSPRKARLLMKSGKAKPYKGKTGHFTIQLIYGSSGYKQPVVVGIDTGSKRVPIAAVAGTQVLYVKEIILRTDVKKQLGDRRRYRRNRRNRLRYREPRFLNRVKTKCARCGVNNVPKVWKKVKRKTGTSTKWVSNGRAELCRPCKGKKGLHNKPHILAPSVKNRADSILRDVDKLAKSLPVSRVVVEIASFDTQKMANARIEGIEYQHGTLWGEEVRSYLFAAYKHKCAYCGGLSGDKILNIDHVVSRDNDGSDKISNLVVSCRTCNNEKSSMSLEKWEKRLRAVTTIETEINDKGKEVEIFTPAINGRRLKAIPKIAKRRDQKKGFQYSALTQSYKNYLLDELRQRFHVNVTYGANTKYARKQMEIEKSQINDAMVIASEGQPFIMPDAYILEKQIKKRRPAEYISPCIKKQPITKRKWEDEVFGFRLYDRVRVDHPILGIITGYITSRTAKDGVMRVGSLEHSNLLAYLLNEELGFLPDGKQRDPKVSYKKLILTQSQQSNSVRERVCMELPERNTVYREPEQMELGI